MEDIECDLLRFFPQFGTDPFESIDGPRFFRLAPRLPAYDGVMTRRFEAEAAQEQALSQSGGRPQLQAAPATLSGLPVPEGAKIIDFESLMAETNKIREWA